LGKQAKKWHLRGAPRRKSVLKLVKVRPTKKVTGFFVNSKRDMREKRIITFGKNQKNII